MDEFGDDLLDEFTAYWEWQAYWDSLSNAEKREEMVAMTLYVDTSDGY